ncbi:MAG: AAA family ATPase, partial [Chloroflexota bacterium]|nr:AAA family ATPase [Chloroflexota bacterium]
SRLVHRAREHRGPLTLVFHGPDVAGKRRVAEALAREAGALLLVADLAQSLENPAELPRTLRLVFREARFHDALLYLEGVEALDEQHASLRRYLQEALASSRGIAIVADPRPERPAHSPDGGYPAGAIGVPFPVPTHARRRECWRSSLATAGVELEPADLEALAGRYRLLPDQIEAAVATASGRARWHAATSARPELDGHPSVRDLFAAVRTHSAGDLGSFARKVTPSYGWEDIVLPPDRMRQLREICSYVQYRALVYDEWGFDHKLALGKGLNVLFAGPSGTGKTMAADIIAGELGLDLYKIDLSAVVSKYVGDTEKHLSRIFAAAEASSSILFFDEADALFGKRGEVRDSHDRYANLEVSYLLQRMEEYDGVVILTTNLRKNMDEAFVRRLHFTVEFPFPDQQDRQRIWERIWPDRSPLTPELDLSFMSRSFDMAGGSIRNVALGAAFLAAAEGSAIGMEHLVHATRREYQKLGKVVSEREFGGYSGQDDAR